MTCNVIFISVPNSFWSLSAVLICLMDNIHFIDREFIFMGCMIIHALKNQLHGLIYKKLIKVVDKKFISVKTVFCSCTFLGGFSKTYFKVV